jgi:hypothetical protein
MNEDTDGVEVVNGEFIVSCWWQYLVCEGLWKQTIAAGPRKKINSADIGYDPVSHVYVPTFSEWYRGLR